MSSEPSSVRFRFVPFRFVFRFRSVRFFSQRLFAHRSRLVFRRGRRPFPAALGGGSFRFTVLDHTHLTAPVPLPANLQKYKSDNHARAILYHQKRMDEQKRAQLAAFSGGSAPPATPVFFLLGCDPMIFLPLNPVRTAAEEIGRAHV